MTNGVRVAIAVAFGVGLLLTSATQLRFGGLPIGPGELWLTGVISVLVFRAMLRRELQASWPLQLIAAYWTFGLVLLCVGWLVGLEAGYSELGNGRDLVAFIFVAATMTIWVASPGQLQSLRIIEMTVAVGCVLVMSLLIVVGTVLGGRVGPVEVWYELIRFRGWAENPNQLGFLLLPVPVLLLDHGRRARGWQRYACVMAAGVAVILGVVTASDALMLAWAAMGLAGFLGWWVFAATRPTRQYARAAWLRVILPILVILVAGFATVPGITYLEREVRNVYGQGGQGGDRVARWVYGLYVVNESPIVGYGPGAFSGPTGPHQRQEAHSTPIDWAASTGALGLLALGGLVAAAAWRSFRNAAFSDMLMLGGLMLFSLFHYVSRQPLFWFFLVAILARPRSLPGNLEPSKGAV